MNKIWLSKVPIGTKHEPAEKYTKVYRQGLVIQTWESNTAWECYSRPQRWYEHLRVKFFGDTPDAAQSEGEKK